MAAQKQEISSIKEVSEKYPKNTTPFENQVAGHSFNDGCYTVGMLRDEEGHVLKPVNKPEQGRREIEFYESLLKSSEEEIVQLKKFVPEYLGTVVLSVEGRSTTFLKLVDATRGYEKPCVMDVKMGRQTWEPGVSKEKQQREEGKYTFCKQQCGFCIPGFQVWNITNETVEKYGKEYGRKLKKEDIPQVLRKFLNIENVRSRMVAAEMLRQLNNILEWWKVQRRLHVYSSSILLTYDAHILLESNLTDKLSRKVRVMLIDFAHVLPGNGTLDFNYLLGLETFVQIFTSVLNEL